MIRKYSAQPASSILALLLCALLLLLSACSSPFGGASSGSQGNVNRGDGKPTMSQTASATSQQAQQTVPMPQTDTSCPAAGMARAAVMRPLVLGKDQNIVYSDGASFKRYDVQAKLTTTLLSLPRGTSSNSGTFNSVGQISADGQWLLFLSNQTHAPTQLQLIRMDGQGLQTLYCFSPNDGEISAQWSVDEKLIALSVAQVLTNTGVTSSLSLLDVTSGHLKPLFQGTNTDFYGRIAWLDNTHLYVDREVRQTSSQGTLYLMNVATATANNPGFQTVLTYAANAGYISYDSSYNATKLFFSQCQFATTTITVNQAISSIQQASFHENACIPMIRSVSANSVLMLAEISNNSSPIVNQVWIMRPDGSGRQVLATLSPTVNTEGVSYSLNPNSQFPWSNISRDGGSYALEENNGGGSDQGVASRSILIGSLSGGTPTVIDIPFPSGGNGNVDVVGWTMM